MFLKHFTRYFKNSDKNACVLPDILKTPIKMHTFVPNILKKINKNAYTHTAFFEKIDRRKI